MENKTLILIIAVFFPFIAVFMHKGASKDLLINIVLCFFGYIPGIIHAIWLITKK